MAPLSTTEHDIVCLEKTCINVYHLHHPLHEGAENLDHHSVYASRPQRRVSFSNDLEQIFQASHLHDFTSVWWTREDYEKISFNRNITLQKMMHGNIFESGDDESCALGLELYTQYARLKRRKQHQRVKRAVLKAQAFQRYEGIYDPKYISELSRRHTAKSRDDALSRAS
jgi:hypothetical protein